MGNHSSIADTDKMNTQLQQTNENDNSVKPDTPFDKELLSVRRSLKMDQEAFLLNNLMLCVQFFENYDREISDIRSRSVSKKERELNKVLSQNDKHVLLPDVLQEQVSNHVKFKSSKSIDFESIVEPIQPVRIHVVLENIDVNQDKENRDRLASTDSSIYKMHLDPSPNHGFVRLRSTNETTSPTTVYNQSMPSLYNVDKPNRDPVVFGLDTAHSQINLSQLQNPNDEGYEESLYGGFCEHGFGSSFNKQNSNLQTRHRRSVESIPRSSLSSGYKSGSSGTNYVMDNDLDYGYATIASSRTSMVSSVSQVSLPASSTEIPASCFKKFVCTRDGKFYNDQSKRAELQNLTDRRIRRAEQCQNEERSYLRRDKFRRYFAKLFVNRLAQPLGFDIEDENDAIRRGAVIHCYSIELQKGNPTLITPHEIVPSIAAEWPECCAEWLERSRRAVANSEYSESWLTEEIIDRVEQLGCHIIPESFITTKNSDPYYALEWQITLPAAERHLETCLSHSQAHVYLMTLGLHKSFIRCSTENSGLTASHIRSQLFWLLDKNCSSLMWSENRGGENLRGLLTTLYHAVSKSEPLLEDYFIRGKNLLQNISRQYLHTTHKQLKRIIDNPVMYLIAAMKNMNYKPEFYPVLDYRRLYKLLTLDHRKLVAFINPALGNVERPMQRTKVGKSEDSNEDFDRLGENTKSMKRNGNSINQTSTAFDDSIVEITDECAELHGLRLSVILDMFIRHFIKMAECCYNYGAIKQKEVYLDQAHRLSIILCEQPRGKEDATSHLEEIKTLRLSGFKEQGEAGETSERNDQPVISIPLNSYFTDEQESTTNPSNVIETNEYDVHYTHGGDNIPGDSEESYL